MPYNDINESPDERKKMLDESKQILTKVQVILEDEDKMDELMEIGFEEINDYIQ